MKPEHEESGRHRNQYRNCSRENDCNPEIQTDQVSNSEGGVSADPDVGLLAEAVDAGIAGEQIPQLAKCNENHQLGERDEQRSVGDERDHRQDKTAGYPHHRE